LVAGSRDRLLASREVSPARPIVRDRRTALAAGGIDD
jgi:hypothetical protein